MRTSLLGAAAMLPAVLVACGGGDNGAVTPTPRVITGTPTTSVQRLRVTLVGEPARTFALGRWHVCDHGTVTNPSSLVARDVRLVVTYYDHGLVDGQTTRADASTNGGALGDIAPGLSHDFTVCGYARNEPDDDVVTATLAP